MHNKQEKRKGTCINRYFSFLSNYIQQLPTRSFVNTCMFLPFKLPITLHFFSFTFWMSMAFVEKYGYCILNISDKVFP